MIYQSILGGVVVMGAAVAVGLAFAMLVRRRIPAEGLGHHNEVATPIYGTLGVIYAVMLAFAVISVWESYSDAETAVATEAGVLQAIEHEADLFAPGTRASLLAAIENYRGSAVEEIESESPPGVNSMDASDRALWRIDLGSSDPVARDIYLSRLSDLDAARSARESAGRSSVPGLVWFLLIAGAVVTIIYPGLMIAEHASLHYLMISLLAAIVGLTLYLIWALDSPFRGAVRVGAEAFGG